MLTVEELERFDVFAELEPADYERIIRAAGDISVKAGEYLAHAGSEPALFGVITGRVEVTSSMSGEERVLGQRRPGDVVGEISITMAMRQPGNFRAAEDTRVFKIEADACHALAAATPVIATRLREKANYRVGGPAGLQALVAAAAQSRAIVVGYRGDPACAELRHFLERNQVRFQWLQPDLPGDHALWPGSLPADSDLPVIRVSNGKTVVKPQLRRVAQLLDIATEPAEADYDTIVVGAGPGGLAAAVYGASEGLRTIVIECQAPGGQAGSSTRIENYLGFPAGVSGNELSSLALEQAHRLGAEVVVTRRITRIDPVLREVHLDGGDVLRTRTIILACGVSWRRLEIEGFDRLVDKGISYGAARSEATNSHDLDIHIIGAGNSAGQAAMFFSAHARSVTILCRGDSLDKSMSRYLIDQLASRDNINVLFGTQVTGAYGETALEEIDLYDSKTKQTTRVPSGGVFIFIGADPETAWLPPEIALDAKRFVLTGSEVKASGKWQLERDPYLLETSVPGIFACGDVRSGPVKRVAAAVGEGSMAIAFVHQYLKDDHVRAKQAKAS